MIRSTPIPIHDSTTNGDSHIIAQPSGQSAQLFVLCHGFGADAADLAPVGQVLANAYPQATVVSLNAPSVSDLGHGRQWFSVANVTEENRPERVRAAMPPFIEALRAWQHRTHVRVSETALLGFSQGAIMALEASLRGPGLAGRVISLSGRFAELPTRAGQETTYHLIHGKEDRVIPYRHTVLAAERLVSLGGDVTADIIPFTDHEITDEVLALLLERLKGYLPIRSWQEALAADHPVAKQANHDKDVT